MYMLYDVWCIFDEWNGITRADKTRSDPSVQSHLRFFEGKTDFFIWFFDIYHPPIECFFVSCTLLEHPSLSTLVIIVIHPLTPALLKKPWGRFFQPDIFWEKFFTQKPGTKKAAKIRAPNSKSEARNWVTQDPVQERSVGTHTSLGIFQGLC